MSMSAASAFGRGEILTDGSGNSKNGYALTGEASFEGNLENIARGDYMSHVDLYEQDASGWEGGDQAWAMD